MKEEILHNSITLEKMLRDEEIGIHTESKVFKISKNSIYFTGKDGDYYKACK